MIMRKEAVPDTDMCCVLSNRRWLASWVAASSSSDPPFQQMVGYGYEPRHERLPFFVCRRCLQHLTNFITCEPTSIIDLTQIGADIFRSSYKLHCKHEFALPTRTERPRLRAEPVGALHEVHLRSGLLPNLSSAGFLNLLTLLRVS